MPTKPCVWCPPVALPSRQAMEYINDDEQVEVTPLSIRLRKAKTTR